MEPDDAKTHWVRSVRACCIQASGEIDHDWDFTIVCNSKHFVVTVSPGLPQDPTTPLLTQYSKVFHEDDEEIVQEAQDAILDLIFDVGWQQFRAIAPPILEGDSCPEIATRSLHSEINPETYYFRLVVIEGQVEMVQEPPPQPQPNSFHLDLKDDTLDLPRYSSRDITVTRKLMGLGYIAKVIIRGLDMCCKIATAQTFKAVQREYDCLRQIAVSKSAVSIPAPKLLGLVVDDDGAVIGILEKFIENKGTLSDIIKSDEGLSEERRAKWAKQIREAVALLHEIDVVWGDGKAENVLVGSGSEDCFLVDFGGSYTNGWVDSALMETPAGDDQAVEKIVRFLHGEIRP
ncbi:hypothetical protein VTL71DRAFT_11084 [Oculimacula yallundae]|uniref:Protein kinase domain-containing protein n=1 Tax=Oculimacula yallundae TaxID=86028 RepID=A0ABR4CUZ8_9HELO